MTRRISSSSSDEDASPSLSCGESEGIETRSDLEDVVRDVPEAKRLTFESTKGKKMNELRQPGIEPGAAEWEPAILPLNHWRSLRVFPYKELVINL